MQFDNDDLSETGWAVQRGCLSESERTLAVSYYTLRLAAGAFDAAPDSLSYNLYGDPLGDSILDMLTSSLSKAAGQSLWPAFSFLRLYQQGAKLLPHVDRVSCDVSVSIQLDSEIGQPSWPLEVEGSSPQTLGHGDGLGFMGRRLEHWRPGVAPGFSLWLLLHWSSSPEFFRDGRSGLGVDDRQNELARSD